MQSTRTIQGVRKRHGKGAAAQVKSLLVAVGLMMALIILVLPLVWVVLTSLRPGEALFTRTLELPREINLTNYETLFRSDFPLYILNSVIVVTSSTLLSLLLAFPAAYAFSRRRFRGRWLLLLIVIFTQLFPYITLVTPLYVLVVRLGLVNTHAGLIIIYTAIVLPFAIYMLWGFIDTVPKELDEAAVIDGSTTVGTMVRVILPVAVPGVAAVAIYSFSQMWNEYLIALTVITNDRLKTLPVGLAGLFGEQSIQWDLVMAGSVIATLPTILMFLPVQTRLVQGVTAGIGK